MSAPVGSVRTEPRLPDELNIHRIRWPTDFSEPSMAALKPARACPGVGDNRTNPGRHLMGARTPQQPPRLAVIDDDEELRRLLVQTLQARKYAVEDFPSAEAALAWPRLAEVDAVLTDVQMPGLDGEALLAEIVARNPAPPVIVITGHGDIEMAVRCLKHGAYDFVTKPFEDEVLLASVARSVEASALRREREALRQRLASPDADDEPGRWGMIGRSDPMLKVYEQIAVVARSDAPVAITGETGAGKELVARAIHRCSPRADGPYVAVNAGALPETMLASELFGHKRGAFTGAASARDGKLVTATGGTLFLDEVESISAQAQIQLLRVLEDGLVEPLGGDRPREVDVRLLTATKQDLKDEVRAGRMREDFYHRIAVLTVAVPPLRQRREDIPLLVSHFVREATERIGLPAPEIPEGTLERMLGHAWPGNVRELRNAVERMIVTTRKGVAGPFRPDDDLGSGRLLSLPGAPGRLRDELERTERTVIAAALKQSGGEVSATAQALGISRRALYERMKRYGLRKEEFRGGR